MKLQEFAVIVTMVGKLGWWSSKYLKDIRLGHGFETFIVTDIMAYLIPEYVALWKEDEKKPSLSLLGRQTQTPDDATTGHRLPSTWWESSLQGLKPPAVIRS